MPLDYEVSDRMREPSLAELGLSPAVVVNVPAWFLAEPEPEARYLCDEYSFEWQLRAGPNEAALLEQARELATQHVLRAELENRELRKRNEAQAAELRRLRELRTEAMDRALADVNAAQREADVWTEKYYTLERSFETVQRERLDLEEGMAILRGMFEDYGYNRGSLTERLAAMYADLVALRRQGAQSGAVSPRPVPPDAAA